MSEEGGTTTRTVTVRAAPALAGGRLEILNSLLWACAQARRRGPGTVACLVLDEGLLRKRDRGLALLNAHGDPVVLAGPGDGRLDAAARTALLETALDVLPPTAEAREVLDVLLPRPGASATEAAEELWTRLLGPCGLVVRRAGDAEEAQGERGAAPPDRPEVTWFGPRHLQLLRSVRAAPSAALEGEDALRRAFTPQEARALLAALQDFDRTQGRGLAALEEAVQDEEPQLLGAWTRLRRESGRALREFRRRVERSQRNRSGIRGARLHALAQGLRPHDEAQERHLGLVVAAAAFRLDWRDLGRYLPAFEHARADAPLFIATEGGDSVLGMEGP